MRKIRSTTWAYISEYWSCTYCYRKAELGAMVYWTHTEGGHIKSCCHREDCLVALKVEAAYG